MLKKTNYIYKKFDNSNLSIIQNQLNIEGKKKILCSEFNSENSKINIKIYQTYESKGRLDEKELEISKANEIFINADNYKKKQIKITTKMSITKTKFIHKRFNNNYISHENQINIKRERPKFKILESSIIQNQNELEQLKNQEKGYPEKGIKKEEKTTDTIDLERKEIKITTKKIIKKTNILKSKFNNNSICENVQIIINKAQTEKESDKINKINKLKIINKRNRENIINKVSEIHLCHHKFLNNNYNITEKIFEDDNNLTGVKLHSKKNKITEQEKSEPNETKQNKKKKLKTVVVFIDKKFDLKNCFDKWNNKTKNIELKNTLKNKMYNKIQPKSHLALNKIEKNNENEINEQNKTTEDLTNFETINFDDKKNSTMNTKSSNNEKKEGKKRRIKIKYIKKNNKDNSINSSKSSENKLSLSEEMNSSLGSNEIKIIKSRNSVEENIEMKSLEPKRTKKPFILRINKVEVKKKILKSNSKTVHKGENEDINNKIISLYSPLIARHFLKKWKLNETNDINLVQKLRMRFIIKSLMMSKKINKFKIHMIKYIFKNK